MDQNLAGSGDCCLITVQKYVCGSDRDILMAVLSTEDRHVRFLGEKQLVDIKF